VTDPACDLSEPAEGDNGILPLGINYPPVIANLVVPERLTGEETAEFTADINDPEGETVSVVWSATYGTIDAQAPSDGVLTSVPFNTSANYTAPAQDRICKVTLTATDSEGNTSEASKWIWMIHGEEGTGTIEGTLYGPDGQPVPGIRVSLINFLGNLFDHEEFVTTDVAGHYVFNDVPCCPDVWVFGFSGMITTALDVDGTIWNFERGVSIYCCGDGGEGYDPMNGDVPMAAVGPLEGNHYTFNIRFPLLWGTLSGTAYNEDGSPDGAIGGYRLKSLDNYLNLYADIFVNEDGTYGPAAVPVTILSLYSQWKNLTLLHDGESVILDIGPGAVGTMGGYLYSDDGNTIAGGAVKMGSEETVTNAEGYYSFANVETGLKTILIYEETPGDSSSRVYGEGMVMQRGETARADIRGRGCTVTGTLYNYYGTIMPFVEVYLSVHWEEDNWGNRSTAITDANGVFMFENLGGSATWPDTRKLPTGSAYIDIEDEYVMGHIDFSISESNSDLTVDLHTYLPYQEWGGGF